VTAGLLDIQYYKQVFNKARNG